MNKLSQLPNIGGILEQKLLDAEISTPEQLIQTGAEQAFLKLSVEDTSACYNMLCALEGAILKPNSFSVFILVLFIHSFIKKLCSNLLQLSFLLCCE